MWFKSVLRSLKRFLYQCFREYFLNSGVVQIQFDKTQIHDFAHQYIGKVEQSRHLEEDEKQQVLGFLEYTLMPKYTVGMVNKHKARNLINKYQQTLASYS